MKIRYNREKVGDGIHFTTIINECQKTNTLIIHLVTELSVETASLNAVIPYVLSGSSDKYKTITELNLKLSELYGAALRGSVSKLGDSQIVSLMAGCINDRYTFDEENITEESAEVLIDCLTNPYVENGGFFECDFNLKKQELLDDIDAEINEKRSYALRRAGETIYKNEPCSVSAKGDRASAERVDFVSAYEQYKKLLETAQIEAIYVGASEPGMVKDIVTERLSGLKRSYKGENHSDFSPLKDEPVHISEQLDVVQSKMVMAFKSDCKNIHAMKLMNAVFGSTPFSKLFLNVREKLSLCYYCASSYNDKKGVMLVDSGVEHANIEKAQAEILNQLEKVKNGEFTDDEINEARLSVINRLRSVNDGARSIADWYFKQSYSGTALSPEDEIQEFYSVKREDIIEAAKSLALDTVYVLTGKESAENE
ncbi:MAG: insulinase family protein [Oscillospiraceae bacterium]|nr:insulinase family protein [Oscillospiraceae bacterium]